MIIWTILSWVMSIIALAGTILNAERNIYGFVFWIVSNMYMTIRFAYIGEYAQACLFLIYTILAVRGIIAWRKKEQKSKWKLKSRRELEESLERLKKLAEEIKGNKKS